MKTFIFLLLSSTIALAQTGTSKPASQLTTEVNANLADNTSGGITPFIMRQTLNDMIASSGNFQTSSAWLTIQNFNAGLTSGPMTVAVTPGSNYYANLFQVTWGATVNSGNTNSSFGVLTTINSTTYTGSQANLSSILTVQNFNQSATNPNDVAFAAESARVNAAVATTNANSGVWAGNDVVNVTATGWAWAVGREIDIVVNSAATASVKTALLLTQEASDAVQGSLWDAGILFHNASGTVGWKNGIYILPGVISAGGNAFSSPGFTVADVGSTTVNPGTLAPNAHAVTIIATQPAVPTGAQSAINWNITSNGTAGQNNFAMILNYLAGYTGPNNTNGLNITNAVGGTASNPLMGPGSNAVAGNIGNSANASGTTTGLNVGDRSVAQNAYINVGEMGYANIATSAAVPTWNIGGLFSAYNTVTGGSTPFTIGVMATLAGTALPSLSAALIADTATLTTVPIAIFRANSLSVATVTSTGGLTATLPTSAGGGGLYVCVDNTVAGGGVFYKKASCP